MWEQAISEDLDCKSSLKNSKEPCLNGQSEGLRALSTPEQGILTSDVEWSLGKPMFRRFFLFSFVYMFSFQPGFHKSSYDYTSLVSRDCRSADRDRNAPEAVAQS